ncbi:MAG: UbiD family decarboxylase [Deltaproteobacteria bacterium]|nr:UbiD family decarboxylase [Deltaproteobacteria bacterium]
MMFRDLREFISKAEEVGEYRVIEGADWDEEIGAIGDLMSQTPDSPLLVFDKIKGYPAGYRVATNLAASAKRIALCFGLPQEARGIELVRAFRDKLKEEVKPIPPVEVATGPVKENVLLGDDVDVYKFPTPKWHELDGGRYIGTGSAVVTRNPDDGRINVGTYRVQVQDKSTVTISLAQGHHGNIIARKYWAKGLPCPMAICCGQAPIIYAASHFDIPWGFSEYDWAGGWQKEPIQVTRGVATDLPIPATAEIVLEGELVPPGGETRPEGPFGEWDGYYAGGVRQLPAFRVKGILHRNNPILQGNPPSILPRVWTLGRHIQKAAALWAELDRQLPGVNGVWMIEEATVRRIAVISLQQLYGGHAKQAAALAAGVLATAYALKYIIVVDEDIDPSNISEVLWALGTRSEPEEIETLKGWWGNWSNPLLTPEQREMDDRTRSLGIILACKPYKYIKDFPPSIRTSPEMAKKVREKFPELFK